MADQTHGEQAIDAMKKIIAEDVAAMEDAGRVLDRAADADCKNGCGVELRRETTAITFGQWCRQEWVPLPVTREAEA